MTRPWRWKCYGLAGDIEAALSLFSLYQHVSRIIIWFFVIINCRVRVYRAVVSGQKDVSTWTSAFAILDRDDASGTAERGEPPPDVQ
jgi:hypothetical protein